MLFKLTGPSGGRAVGGGAQVCEETIIQIKARGGEDRHKAVGLHTALMWDNNLKCPSYA